MNEVSISMNQKLLFVFLTLFLLGCSKSIDVQLASDAQVYSSKDNAKKAEITADDAAYKVLEDWLAENKDGWYATSGKYSGGVYVRSGEHGIQVKPLKVVIYSTKGEKPQAIYVKDINKGDLASVLAYLD